MTLEHAVGIRTGDLATLIVYFAITLGIGFWCSKRLTSTEGYFVGGRKIPGWAVGISMLGTAISSVTFLAYPGSAFAGNWSKLVPGLTIPIAAVFAVYVFVPFYRKVRLVSAYEYLERRFGAWARVYGCITWSLNSAYRMGIILFLLSLLIRKMTGYDLYATIIVMGVLVTIYTVMGGIEAVIWTDVMQTIVLLLGGILCISTVFIEIPGGIGAVFTQAIQNQKFNLTVDWNLNFVRETIWVLMLYGLMQNLQEFASDQTKIQRYCAASSDQGAKRSVWIGGLGCIPVWMIFMFVGTSLWVFYQNYAGQLPEGILPDDVFPHFILTQLPVGLAGLVIAAALAAAMSSIDSCMNGVSTVLTTDIYRRFMRRGSEDRHYLNVARFITGLAGFLMISASVFLAWIVENEKIQLESILGLGFFIYSVLACGVGGMYFLGFFTKRSNSMGVLIGIILAFAITLWMTLSEIGYFPKVAASPFHRLMINVFSNVASFVVGYFASYLFPKPPKEKLEHLTVWNNETSA
ncbi:MAG: sodium:solute symporter [Candidatus Omnitrophica bacterium]|nr:sodium:solute symporter [Candidatus Omnitrophota bacterium]